MILSDSRILEEIAKGTIVIEPFDRKDLGSNSYDVHLGKFLAMYDDTTLDARKHNTITHYGMTGKLIFFAMYGPENSREDNYGGYAFIL